MHRMRYKLSEATPPPLLREIYDPPKKLFVKGVFPPHAPCVAIVGTREPTNYGREMAKWFSSVLAKRGYVIVSGFARGIDRVAHEAALEAKGKTIAVLGWALDFEIHWRDQKLQEKIIEHSGAIISEFPLGTKPSKITFPKRNRIISGLSIATLVIEAGEKSGALITARYALEQNREVFAIPGNLGWPKSTGCNNLLKKGEGQLVASPEEMIAIIEKQPLPFSLAHPKCEDNLSPDEKRVFEILSKNPLPFDDLLLATKFSPSQLQGILTRLELKNLLLRDRQCFSIKSR